MLDLLTSLILFATLTTGGPAHEPAAAPPRPVLVELFTSQGCPLCPAANEYLGDLDARGDVIALGFAVSYWDVYGWRDTYARPEFTERQRIYKSSLDVARIYTPQFVIDGAAEASGAETDAIRSALERRRIAMTAHVDVSTQSLGDGNHRIRVDDTTPTSETAEVWLAVFEPGWHVVNVEGGQNDGLAMRLYNPVQALLPLSEWQSEETFFGASLPRGSSAVVIVQAQGGGEVFGASQFLPDPTDAVSDD